MDGTTVKVDGKGHRGKEVGNCNNVQILGPQLDDSWVGTEQAQHLRSCENCDCRKQQRHSAAQDNVDAQRAADIFNILDTPILRNIDRSTTVNTKT